MFFAEVKEAKICRVIKDLNLEKVKGPDRISPRVVRETEIYVAKLLAYILHIIFENGIYPKFKSAMVFNISKVFESCLKKRIPDCIKKNILTH